MAWNKEVYLPASVSGVLGLEAYITQGRVERNPVSQESLTFPRGRPRPEVV